MSGEENKKPEAEGSETQSAGLSRRTFLRDAGLAVGGPALVGSMVNAQVKAGAPKAAPAATQSKTAAAAASKPKAAAPSPSATTIALTVNGGKYKFDVEPNWTLRQLLRDEIGLTSPKDWCGGFGACGSCTVIMNGRPILSCMTLACECNGAIVETAEGIAKAKHPLIEAYIKQNAFQCGYCTPGFVTTAKALLDKNKNPTEDDVRDALGGNLCRCGTYQQHPVAVLDAAKRLAEDV
jgi:aerobic-type carbon monoxide dehydrogenase small subunit (CoxS/CutS family)